MKNMKLRKNEVTACKELFEKIAANPEMLDQMLRDLGKDPEDIRAQLNQGVDDFYRFYEGEVSVDTIKEKMAEATASMSPLQQYSYYANLMTAFSHIGGQVFGDEAWTKCLSDHQNILSAIELGLIEEDDMHITDGIAHMQQIVAENIEAFAVLFVDDPDMEALQEACMSQDTATVKAMALNSRELAVDMAAAVYLMQESGELKSLGDTRYSARDIGVMAASGLEIDAARKTGDVETAKKIIRKAAVAAVALVVTAPFALALGLTAWLAFDSVALMLSTSFYMYLTLSTVMAIVSGAAMLVFGTSVFGTAKETVNMMVEKGAKVLDTAVEAIKPVCEKVSDWVRNTVVPAAQPVWEKCRNFTYHRIMVPAVSFILKYKDVIIQNAEKIALKAKAFYEKVSGKVVEIYYQGRQTVNNIISAAQNQVSEDVTGENVGGNVNVNVDVPDEFEMPVEDGVEEENSEFETDEVENY